MHRGGCPGPCAAHPGSDRRRLAMVPACGGKSWRPSASAGTRSCSKLTRPSFERYADRHGYELAVPTTDPAPERRRKHWAKIALINRLLPECDLLLWVDADAAIVDSSMDIEEALPEASRLGPAAHRYSGQLVPNTGVMLVRWTHSSRRFFQKVWGMTEYLETTWHDNAAVLTLLGFEFDFKDGPDVVSSTPADQVASANHLPRSRMELAARGHGRGAAHRPRHQFPPLRGASSAGLSSTPSRVGTPAWLRHDPASDKKDHPRVGSRKKGSSPRTHPRVIGAPR